MGGSIVEDTYFLTDYIGLTPPGGEDRHQTSTCLASLLLCGEVPHRQTPEGSTEGNVATERRCYLTHSLGTGVGFALSIREIAIEDLYTVAVEDGVVAISA